ncbi:MAG: CoA-binding protein [Acidobacteria bacterium]|nr:CoA-binding protein [Acidobacteriota bacterium]
MSFSDPTTIERILTECRTIAVVGLSSNPIRPSYGVSKYMQDHGYHILPVNPNETEVLGERAYADLQTLPVQPDLVNIFRRSEDAGAIVDEAIALNVKAVWLQEGVIDEAAAERAADADLLVVMDRCLLKEHLRINR